MDREARLVEDSLPRERRGRRVSKDEGGESKRLPWSEGPDEEAPAKSWLLLDDDELLHKIETLGAAASDERLIEVVASNRHFFIRQEAAKRIKDHDRLFDFVDDRHVGQILVRHLTRREDLTYLQQLSRRSRHVEVRSAAQVQLARLWRRLDSPPAEAAPAPEEPESAEAVVPAPKAPLPASPAPAAPAPPPGRRGRSGRGEAARPVRADHQRRAREGRRRRQPARLGGPLPRAADLVRRRDGPHARAFHGDAARAAGAIPGARADADHGRRARHDQPGGRAAPAEPTPFAPSRRGWSPIERP